MHVVDASRIARFPNFSDLPAEELDELAAAMREVEVEAGATIVTVDDYGTAIYFIEEGAAEYDFLHGDESYKFRWSSEVRPLFRIELYPPGVVGRMHRDSVMAVAATKQLVKRALNAPLNR